MIKIRGKNIYALDEIEQQQKKIKYLVRKSSQSTINHDVWFRLFFFLFFFFQQKEKSKSQKGLQMISEAVSSLLSFPGKGRKGQANYFILISSSAQKKKKSHLEKFEFAVSWKQALLWLNTRKEERTFSGGF